MVAIDLITQHVKMKLYEEDLQKVYPTIRLTGPRKQVTALLTTVRDRHSDRSQLCFQADRLSRLVVEEGLSNLPFREKTISTPLDVDYVGLEFASNICGVSIVRAGETMEAALRQVVQGIKIGKVLIDRGSSTEGKENMSLSNYNVVYTKLPKDIHNRYVLLMDPVIGQGFTAVKAVEHLIEAGVSEERIVFLNLIASPGGMHNLCGRYPKLQVVTCCIDKGLAKNRQVFPGVGNFGDRYFGTEQDDCCPSPPSKGGSFSPSIGGAMPTSSPSNGDLGHGFIGDTNRTSTFDDP